MKIWTVGHSTHSFDAFLALLAAHEIALVADIRTVPKSRRHPHFHADALARSLPDHGMALRAPAPPGRLAARGGGLAERRLAQ